MVDSLNASIEHQDRGRVTVIKITGELDALAGPRLEDAIQEALDRGALSCVIDLSGATFIDSIGVGTMIRSQRAAAARGAALLVAGAQGPVAQLLKVTQLHRVLRVHPHVGDAVRAAETETN